MRNVVSKVFLVRLHSPLVFSSSRRIIVHKSLDLMGFGIYRENPPL